MTDPGEGDPEADPDASGPGEEFEWEKPRDEAVVDADAVSWSDDLEDIDWSTYGLAREAPSPIRREETAERPDSESIEPIDPPQEAVVDALKEYFDPAPLPELAGTPAASFLEESFFDFEYADEHVEVERSWAWKPYSYNTVLYDREEQEYHYHVVEPALDEFERFLRADLTDILRDVLLYEPVGDATGEQKQAALFRRAVEVIDDYARDVDPGSIYKVQYYLQRDLLGFDRIDPLMRDRRIEDISCDGTDVPVFVYHREYRDLRTDVSFEKEPLNAFVVTMAQRAGKHVSVADPMVDASLPDGSRVQLTLGEEVSPRGSNFTIRRFADVPITPVDLVAWNTFTAQTMAYFWLLLENNMSVLFAGGTASGKTTSLNAVSMFIPPKSKVISIEDTREITLPNENWIQSTTRTGYAQDERGNIGMYELLQASLRQRPEYLLVGEIRTEANVALTFFQAMATGHTACTTFHADSVDTVLSRLQNPPLSVPAQMIRELDVVSIQRQVFQGGARVRRNVAISELSRHPDKDAVQRNDCYRWDPEADVFEKVGESLKLEEVRKQRGWTQEHLEGELRLRERFIEGMVTEDVRDFSAVTEAIRTFQRAPQEALERLENGEFGTDGPEVSPQLSDLPEARITGGDE